MFLKLKIVIKFFRKYKKKKLKNFWRKFKEVKDNYINGISKIIFLLSLKQIANKKIKNKIKNYYQTKDC